MTLRMGDRVRLKAWTSWPGVLGSVTTVQPHIYVLLDGDRLPVRVGHKEIELIEAAG